MERTQIKNRKKLILIAVIVIAIICVLFFAPPIMIAKGLPILGKNTEDFSNPWDHIDEQKTQQPYVRAHSSSDFNNFYFLNLKFWEKLDIQQVEYLDEVEDAQVTRILPFLYSAKQTLRSTYRNTFGIKRGDTCWYFDYIYNPFMA